jgi:copper chaperone
MSEQVTTQLSYAVPEMSCGHCRVAISESVTAVEGVEIVDTDLPSKRVTVVGNDVDDGAVRAAIVAAGYEPQ